MALYNAMTGFNPFSQVNELHWQMVLLPQRFIKPCFNPFSQVNELHRD